jgi:phosphoglycerol transferase MdoB-like AlkP superfamily enzyme
MISIGECGLYREWKAKLSMQALSHFADPAEVFRTTSTPLMFFFFASTLVLSALYLVLYFKFIRIKLSDFPTSIAFTNRLGKVGLSLIIIAFIWTIAFRGGIGNIPIQSSDSFFCNEQHINDAAVNPFWNLMSDFVFWMYHGKENPYNRLEKSKVASIISKVYEVKKDTTEVFLNIKKPNLVFIILESWSANCVKSFGGDDFAPFADSLCLQGIRFTNFYPAGYVSDQGIPAILSGFPASSRIAIINQTSKSLKLPCINQDLAPKGYSSGFVFGGDLNYGNIRSYLFTKNWQHITEEKNLPKSMEHGALGIHDNEMATVFLQKLNQAKPPFVYSWFTVSTHMPYDYKEPKKKLTEIENDFVNSITYSDQALRIFFSEAKKQPWYDSTLFVVCADHSHGAHIVHNACTPEYNKIPMFFFGNVIKREYQGKEITSTFNQVDIAPTLLCQMGLQKEAKEYYWGKNMFNPYSKKFSFYCSFNNSGIVFDKGYVVYQYQNNSIATMYPQNNKELTDSLTKVLLAIQQGVYQDYLDR